MGEQSGDQGSRGVFQVQSIPVLAPFRAGTQERTSSNVAAAADGVRRARENEGISLNKGISQGHLMGRGDGGPRRDARPSVPSCGF